MFQMRKVLFLQCIFIYTEIKEFLKFFPVVISHSFGWKTRTVSNDPCPVPYSRCHLQKSICPLLSSAASVSTFSTPTVAEILLLRVLAPAELLLLWQWRAPRTAWNVVRSHRAAWRFLDDPPMALPRTRPKGTKLRTACRLPDTHNVN